MFNQQAKLALIDLATDAGKSLSDKTLAMFERELQAYTSDEIISACQKWLRNPNQKFFPRVAELIALIPNNIDKEINVKVWWGVDGAYGGDWSSIPNDEKAKIAQYTTQFCFEGNNWYPSQRQKAFLAFLGFKRVKREILDVI